MLRIRDSVGVELSASRQPVAPPKACGPHYNRCVSSQALMSWRASVSWCSQQQASGWCAHRSIAQRVIVYRPAGCSSAASRAHSAAVTLPGAAIAAWSPTGPNLGDGCSLLDGPARASANAASCFTRCRRQAPTGRHANPTLVGGSDDEAALTIRCWAGPPHHGANSRGVAVASTEQDKRLRAELA